MMVDNIIIVASQIANLASIISPVINGQLLGAAEHPSNDRWHHVFMLSSVIQLTGGLVWLALASGTRQKWG